MIELESVLLMLVISGATPKSGLRLCNGAQLATGPTPGNGWLYSRGLTRCVPFWPTYAVVSEKLRANWNSVLKLYCWIRAGRRSRFQARTWPESVDSGSVSVNPVRISPGHVAHVLLRRSLAFATESELTVGSWRSNAIGDHLVHFDASGVHVLFQQHIEYTLC